LNAVIKRSQWLALRDESFHKPLNMFEFILTSIAYPIRDRPQKRGSRLTATLVLPQCSTQIFSIEPTSSMNCLSPNGILEIVMKAIIIATAIALVAGTSVASAAPAKRTTQSSPQVTAHEQAPPTKASGHGFWGKQAVYKPHWRNKYNP
jgi:hypothetical protein